MTKSISPAREAALRVLLEVEKNPDSDSGTLVREACSGLSEEDARLTTTLVYTVLRNALLLDHQYEPLLSQPVNRLSSTSRILFRMAVAQRFYLSRIPPYAIANESVELARVVGRARKGETGFVNAVAKGILRLEGINIPEGQDARAFSQRYSHPEWLVKLLMKKYGSAAATIMEANNTEPQLVVRANELKCSPDDIRKELEAEDFETERGKLSPQAIRIKSTGRMRDLLRSPSFVSGRIYLQDESSQAVSLIADPQPGMKILDLCAAPGGKATHMAELANGRAEIIATDYSPERLVSVQENIARLGTPGMSVVPFESVLEQSEQGFDLILVDAPCSGLGTLRRNPEIRYRCTEGSIRHLARTQESLLGRAAGMLKTAGAIIYSSCTITNEENTRVIERFLATHPEFRIDQEAHGPEEVRKLRTPDGFYRIWPHEVHSDGFEVVRLIRA